jgi:uncharacterized lipoprotein YddW (UPF0748 family)
VTRRCPPAARGSAPLIVALAILAAGCAGPPRPPVHQPGEPPVVEQEVAAFRGLWITRWDYLTAQDVERAIDAAADLGITDVFFQVRGQADAFYRSELEPWGHQLGGDPGYDPLALAVVRAHHRGLRLHAWVNVYPLWKGLEPPTDPAHPLLSHPEWRLHDETGAPQPLSEFYVVADPTNPAVQDHVAAVMRDICGRYEIDGLHLDYVRFVGEALDPGRLWPGDPPAVERWRRAGGTSDPRTPEGRLIHQAWVRAEISALVARIGLECRALRPDLIYSAAVLRHPAIARDTYQQDAAAWVDAGVLDLALPMIYTADLDAFRTDLAAWRAAVPDERLVPGIGVYKQAAGDLAPQLAACRGTAGWSLFAYSSLFESANPEQDRSPEARALRRALREELGAH